MIGDANTLAEGMRLEADICIVGAGAAGITLALALAGPGRRVLLMEGGGETVEPDTQALYEGESVGTGDPLLAGCRYRVLGGTTTQWAGWCRPFEADDFEVRDWMPLSGWAITAADLAPYYPRAQQGVQAGAFEYDGPTLAARVGKPTLPLGDDVAHYTYQFSPPTRFGDAYRPQLEAAENLQVYLQANLVEVTLAEAGGAVASLAFRTLAGRAFTVVASRYVLALGGIENARMLLASNRQVPEGLGNQGDFVGRCFMGHPHIYRRVFMVLAEPPALDLFFGRTRVMTSDALSGEVEARIMLALGPSPAARQRLRLPAMSVTLRRLEIEDIDDDTGPLPSTTVGQILRSDAALQAFALDVRAENRPTLASRITLGEARDALGMPRVRIDWQVTREDLADTTRSLALIGARLGQAGLGRLWMPLDDEGIFLPSRYDTGCHHMGTTRMAADPNQGVVDADCKVHGLDNLFVAGSSVFATSGFANPTLTIVALAHRLAEHLLGGL